MVVGVGVVVAEAVVEEVVEYIFAWRNSTAILVSDLVLIFRD